MVSIAFSHPISPICSKSPLLQVSHHTWMHVPSTTSPPHLPPSNHRTRMRVWHSCALLDYARARASLPPSCSFCPALSVPHCLVMHSLILMLLVLCGVCLVLIIPPLLCPALLSGSHDSCARFVRQRVSTASPPVRICRLEPPDLCLPAAREMCRALRRLLFCEYTVASLFEFSVRQALTTNYPSTWPFLRTLAHCSVLADQARSRLWHS